MAASYSYRPHAIGGIADRHPAAFWAGIAAVTAGVLLHLPMYLGARDVGYRLAGMEIDAAMATASGGPSWGLRPHI